MLKTINIKNFGQFRDYTWNNHLNKEQFQQVNIIYGRNYSGKTTLSRIVRCIEKNELHEQYQDALFEIICNDGSTISQDALSDAGEKYLVRVYNTDFVKEHLSWLRTETGDIKPFTILGLKNIEIEKQIESINKKLGAVEDKRGLLFDYEEEDRRYSKKDKESRQKSDSFKSNLSDKAGKIKLDKHLFVISPSKKQYIITDIEKDIALVLKQPETYTLSQERVAEKSRFLFERALADLPKLPESKPNFGKHYTATKELLERKIAPNQPITDLINDSLLQEWVRQGIDKHRNKREVCGFCNNPLPSDIWTRLDAHFNEESKQLRTELEEQIHNLEGAKNKLGEFIKRAKSDFYEKLHGEFDTLMERWNLLVNQYSSGLDVLILEAKARVEDVFKPRELKEIPAVSTAIGLIITEFNILIEKHNSTTQTLSAEQERERRNLRLNAVVDFIQKIGYTEKLNEIEILGKETEALKKCKESIGREIQELQQRRRKLEAEQKDESRGAELVNNHLSRYFGHENLRLVPIKDSMNANIKFVIHRDNIQATNLSEGECSLIAFCYFIAKIEDELNDKTQKDKLIIFIDDPISSLDSNHIFFMFSLIDSVIAKPKKYGQLFISTHSLDFLKCLKNMKGTSQHFLIEKQQKQQTMQSLLLPMPKHLKEYATEFNYLFSQIHKIYEDAQSNQEQKNDSFNQFYNLPNNLRKFLEYYLFYKYPNTRHPLENLDKLFDNNLPSLINRVINEYSHLTHIDSGWKPIEPNEAKECAILIIGKIKEKDPEQFSALLESIEKSTKTKK
jgi:wobble nucleotide-excising tRNase